MPGRPESHCGQNPRFTPVYDLAVGRSVIPVWIFFRASDSAPVLRTGARFGGGKPNLSGGPSFRGTLHPFTSLPLPQNIIPIPNERLSFTFQEEEENF